MKPTAKERIEAWVCFVVCLLFLGFLVSRMLYLSLPDTPLIEIEWIRRLHRLLIPWDPDLSFSITIAFYLFASLVLLHPWTLVPVMLGLPKPTMRRALTISNWFLAAVIACACVAGAILVAACAFRFIVPEARYPESPFTTVGARAVCLALVVFYSIRDWRKELREITNVADSVEPLID